MAFLLRGAFCKKRPSKIFAGSAGEKSVENRAGKGPVFLVLPAKNIAAHLKILFIATLKSGSYNGNQMHVSCLRCSRKGMRLDDRKISKRKRRCNHEKQQTNLRNGRLDSNCDNVFIRHLHPYGGFQSSAAVSSALKKYITYAGLTRKNRKAIHSLRRTLASTLLMDGTPLLTISNILGHSSPKTTTGYTKVNLPALRKCALSYGKWEASA